MIAHVVTDGQVLWYPFVALALPALIIFVLTRYDRMRYGRAVATSADEHRSS